METLFADENIIIFLQLVLAMLLGIALGVERSIAGKMAGMRTYALVSLGSCLFIVTATTFGGPFFSDNVNIDPLMRISASIITGIGFLGAGLIIFRGTTLSGLTTAAGLWVSAGIGIAVGFQLYAIAVFTTLLTLFVFTILWFVEEYLEKNLRFSKNDPDDTHTRQNSDTNQ